MPRVESYRKMARSGGRGADWLENWKKEGMLDCWPHREPPWTRVVHSFRKVDKTETKDGVKAAILWLPFNCWEDDEYHRHRRFKDEDHPAGLCPADRFLEWLEQRNDLPDDCVVFEFKAGRERREMMKVDLLGQGKGRDSFKDDLTGKTSFVIAVIPADKPDAVYMTDEKWSLGQAFTKRISDDIAMYGEDGNDPELAPVRYIFEYDSKRQVYSVVQHKEQDCPDEVRKLWDAPGPEESLKRATEPSNPRTLLEAMKASCQLDDVPWDELFEPALEKWKADGRDKDNNDEDATDFDPEKLEKEEKASKRKAPPKEDKPAKESAKEPTKTEKPKAAKEANGEASKERKTRGVKKAAPEPEPPKEEVEVFACGACGADFPSNAMACPSCGALADDDDVDPEPKRGQKF